MRLKWNVNYKKCLSIEDHHGKKRNGWTSNKMAGLQECYCVALYLSRK